ncbi:MAG: DnaD domain protein [Ruminococcaceae bacterium]|nr:DnaD domain protein [Oscillospiraceae bacterium]
MKRYIRSGKAPERTEAFFAASDEELRVLALILAADTPLSAEDIEAAARLETLGDAKDALAFWRGAGLIKTAAAKKKDALSSEDTPKKEPSTSDGAAKKNAQTKKKPVRSADELPDYSGTELSALIEKGNLAAFIEACQEIYGKVLSSTDINILVGLNEELHFSCEYICLLLEYYGEKAKKPMRYVEKVAFSLYDRGVLTFEELEAYIEKDRLMRTREGALRKLFGIGERALSTKEVEAFTRWCVEYGYDDALIGLAYDMTVGATGKASVVYADKIITRWNTEGCKTAADVNALLEREKSEKAAKKSQKSAKEAEKDEMRSFDVDDFFAHALDRSYGKKD